MRFTLRDKGYKGFKGIYQGRNRVGRVYRKADGTYGAFILIKGYRKEFNAQTELRAFNLAASAALGFSSPEALQHHNSTVRASNRQRKNRARAMLADFQRGNYDGFDELFGLTIEGRQR